MQDLSSVFAGYGNLAMKARRLETSGNILRLKKGLYVVSPEISRMELSVFLIANHIYGPSYVSMQTALRYYGLIPENVHSIQSMTLGLGRDYMNSLGTFLYTHVSEEYYNIGITIKDSCGVSFMIATPEKALCDLMVYTPNLNLRFQTEISDYLEYDIRFDMDEIQNMDIDIIRECAKTSRKKAMLNQLIKFIENGYNV